MNNRQGAKAPRSPRKAMIKAVENTFYDQTVRFNRR